jgi:predicted TIM-barrel fold metal-dependent hydrolase
VHVFGDPSRYPAIADRTYTPHEVTLAAWRALSEPYGIQRAVLVQPSAYGTDNSCMLDEMRISGNEVRGVAVIDGSVTDDMLHEMNVLGVRGVRLNLATGSVTSLADVPVLVQSTAARIARLGWHLQILARGKILEAAAALVETLAVPVVFDHMAGAHLPMTAGAPGFEAVLRLLKDGKCWVKISGADHVATRRDAPHEALPVMRRLVAANPERLVWGSDWPHIGKSAGRDGVEYLQISHGLLLDLLREAAGSAYEPILAANPSELYGWP